MRKGSKLGLICAALVCAPACGNDGSAGDDTEDASTGTSSTDTNDTSSESADTESSDGTETTDDDGAIFDVGGDDDGGVPPPPGFPETCEEAANSFTSAGCVFYPAAVPAGSASNKAAFTVSNVSDQMANVTLSDINGQVSQVQVAPGQIHTFEDNGAHQMPMGTAVGNDGLVIESDQVLQTYQFIPSIATPTADASIVLPEQALGTKHRLVAYNDLESSGSRNQYAAIVALEDDTTVTVTLAQPGSELLNGMGTPVADFDNGPDSVEVTIDRLETWVVSGNNKYSQTGLPTNELSGSLIESDKPIAVYSGNDVSYLPENQGGSFNCCADLIATAVPPTTVYGRQYAGVKSIPLGEEIDLWRFVANEDGTEIQLSGGVDMMIDLDEGEFFDVETQEVFWADGNLPYALVHFLTSGSSTNIPGGLMPFDCGNAIATPGDPALEWAYPLGNWLNRYLFPVGPTTLGTWCHDHATVVAPVADWDSVTFDGAMLPAPTEIAGTGMGYVYVQLPNDFHEIEAPDTVGVEVSVYGFIGHGSYFYPGGMGLQSLNPEG